MSSADKASAEIRIFNDQKKLFNNIISNTFKYRYNANSETLAVIKINMIKFVKQSFFGQTFSYDIDSSLNNVLDKFDNLFNNQNRLFDSPNLAGDFVDYPNGFYLYKKHSAMVIRGGGKSVALDGKLESTTNNATKITITIRPNLVFFVLFIGIIIISSLQIANAIIKSNSKNILPFILMLFSSLIIMYIPRLVTRDIKESFEEFIK